MDDDEMRAKKRLFACLDNLDSSDDENEEGQQTPTSIGLARNPIPKTAKRLRDHQKAIAQPDAPLKATTVAVFAKDDPTPAPKRELRNDHTALPGIEREDDSTEPRGSSIIISSDAPAAGDKSTVPQSNKRKLPLFAGLRFYFFPPSDINPARKIRIQKAVSHGAQWIAKWNVDVSHIVVDNDLSFPDLAKYLRINSIPEGTIVVNQDYPGRCIQSCNLLDPLQSAFQVRGSPLNLRVASKDKATEGQKTRLEESLTVKKARGAQIIIPSETSHSSLAASSNTFSIPCANIPSQELGRILDVQHGASDHANPFVQESGFDCTLLGNDDFSKAVRDAKATMLLPLDADENEDEDRDDDEGVRQNQACHEHQSLTSESDASQRAQETIIASKRQKKDRSNQGHLMNAFAGARDKLNGQNPNVHTISILQEMANWYENIRDEWRPRAYRRAIGSLKQCTHYVCSREDAFQLPFIGNRLAAKIEEIAWTGRLRRLDNAKLEPTDQSLQVLLGIYGVGFVQASKWVQQGYNSIQDLLDGGVRLTENQKLGIKHYDDFNQRIPRGEVELLGSVVKKEMKFLDEDYNMIISGSYRRGAADSGDIDILLTKPQTTLRVMRDFLLEKLVPRLFKLAFLTAALSVTGRVDGTKWHGACQLPQELGQGMDRPWRRIDFLLVPEEELGAAMIYFTGNEIFNRSIRLLARRKNMVLNQKGLYKDVVRAGAKKLTNGKLLESRDEKRIFDFLGVPWQEPWERDRY